MILPKTRSLLSIAAQKFPVFLLSSVISYLLSFIFYLPAAHAVPNDGTYYLQANTEPGGAGTSISSTDYKVTNFTLGEVVGGKPKDSDTTSACEAGGSGVCKVNPGWLFTRTKFAASGNFSSKDFLLGESAQTIDSFTYRMTALPSGTGATIQFSQDGSSWYNSSGTLNGSNTLSAGTNAISLSTLGWTAGTFYYKVVYSGPGSKTPSLDSVVLAYGGASAKIRPIFVVSATDGQSDYLRYKIKLCTDAGMTANCQTFDQTASQAGWSGQNAVGSSAYLSGYQAFYTMQSDLTRGNTYYWQAWAIDPAGSNAWSAASSVASFTTNAAPNAPVISSPASGATGVGATPVIVLSTTDAGGDWLRYKIQLATDAAFSQNLSTIDQTASQTGWSGQNSQTNTAYTSAATASYTVQSALLSGKRYFVRAYAIDPAGVNTWSSASSTVTFLRAGVTAGPCTSQPGGDFYIDENCSYTGSSEGVDAGNMTVKAGSTFTLNANQSIVWNPGQAITIQPGASIAINSSAKLTQNYMYTPSSSSSGYPDPIGFAGAVGVYHMDDAMSNTGTTGNQVFDSTGINSGTANGTTIVTGKYGNARSFNGSSNYVGIGTNSSFRQSSAVTYSFWSYFDTGGGGWAMGSGASGGHGYGGVQVTGSQIVFSWSPTTPTTDTSITATTAVPVSQWNHIAVVVDFTNKTRAIYLNGTALTTTMSQNPTNWTPTGSYSSGQTDAFGGRYVTSWNYFTGTLDEVQIFNRALSSMEIMGLYNPSSSGMQFMYQGTNPNAGSYRRRKDINSAAPPLGEWKLDEQTGTGAYLLNTAP